jgi:hypothetical protein
MFFSKDPNRPHWGVSCIDCKLGGSESSLANFTRVRVENKGMSNIETIIALCPITASIADPRGRKPLFRAIHGELQWQTGVKQILASDHPSLCEQDSKTNLYPFMLAATIADGDSFVAKEPPQKRQKLNSGACVSTVRQDSVQNIKRARSQLTTIYCLLVEDPSVLSAALRK